MEQIKILAVLPGLIPSTIIGIIKPLLELSKVDNVIFQVKLNTKISNSYIDKFDVVVFCRNCEYEDLRYLYYAKSKEKKVIYELDDNFFDISTSTELGKYHRYPGRLYVVKRFIELSDLVHVYSNPLKDIAQKYNKNIKKINSYFDFDLIESLSKETANENKVKIVYATSRTEGDELREVFEDALKYIINKYPGIVELYVFGEIPNTLKYSKSVHKLPYINNYDKYIKFFYRKNFTIGLAPLKDDIFHRSKTNNKFREYGACGIAGVYSNVDVYSDNIIDKETGVLVENNSSDWINAIELLIHNPELRNKIAENAREKVKSEFSFSHAKNTWKESLEAVFSIEQEKEKSKFIEKRKVLVVAEKDYDSNKRIKAFLNAVGFMKLNYDIVYLEDFQASLISHYNLVVLFIEHYNEKTTMPDLSIPLIIDCANYEGEVRENTQLVTSNKREVDRNNNIIEIEDYLDFDKNIKNSVEDIIDYTRGDSLYQSIIDGKVETISLDNIEKWIIQAPIKIKNDELKFFSLESSVVRWIELIQSNLENQYFSAPTLIDRLILKIQIKVLLRIQKRMDPIYKRINRFKEKYYVYRLLFNINKKGKYK